MAKKSLPKILVTGASGFIGHHFLDKVKDDFFVYGLSRRLPTNTPLLDHPNIKWITADIADAQSLKKGMNLIKQNGGVDYVLHLAGFYDFNYDENPEYERTNVQGTKNILEALKPLEIKRFIFASSVAACNFPKNGERVSESTSPEADFAYARSKRAGERMTIEYARFFNTIVVRFAAVFSDWCEYGPLYVFLKTWLSHSWKARVLGGKGKSAITYIHIECLIALILKIIEQDKQIRMFDLFIASHETPVTHEELFKLSTKYFYGKERKPFFMPKSIAYPGVVVMDFLGKLIGKRPFERPWMMQYVDKQLYVDAGYTREKLGWKPIDRYRIQRRLLYMLEHMKSYPYEWQKRNMKMSKRFKLSPNYRIYEQLEILKEKIVNEIVETLLDEKNEELYRSYHKIDAKQLRKDTVTVIQFLSLAVRTKDRIPALVYAKQIANVRAKQKFKVQDIINAQQAISEIVKKYLLQQKNLKGMESEVYDEITFTFQLVADEIEGAFESA